MRGNNYEVLDLSLDFNEPQPIPHQTFVERRLAPRNNPDQLVPNPFLSLTVGRAVNTLAYDEFYELTRYQSELGLANGGYEEHDNGHLTPRHDFDPVHATMVPTEKLHVTHLYAGDIGEIIVRNFADDKGRVIRPRDVARRVTRFTRKYNTLIKRENMDIQDRLLYKHGFTANGPRRTLGDDALEEASLAMTNGIFELSGTLGAFGVGNAFGFTFAQSARGFLKSERSRALDMAVDILGVKHIDRDIEDKILSSEHHVTLIRLGLKAPEWEIYPHARGSRFMPETFVTEFDPKAKAILPNEK
jgi:hypothetical protein